MSPKQVTHTVMSMTLYFLFAFMSALVGRFSFHDVEFLCELQTTATEIVLWT